MFRRRERLKRITESMGSFFALRAFIASTTSRISMPMPNGILMT